MLNGIVEVVIDGLSKNFQKTVKKVCELDICHIPVI